MITELRPALFIDRDGTLNHEVNYLDHPDKLILLPGVSDALRLARTHGWSTVVITNQSGVGRGYFTVETLHDIHGRLHRHLEDEGITVDGLYFCPHIPQDACECRKPRPGMLRQAADELGIDLERSWMIGDNVTDIEAGRNAGCQTALVLTGHGARSKADGAQPTLVADTLLDAVQRIVAIQRVPA